jgi:hypothetical protein
MVYRSHFVISEGGVFSARGAFNQILLVQPKCQTVVAKFSSRVKPSEGLLPGYESGREAFVMNEIAKVLAEQF